MPLLQSLAALTLSSTLAVAAAPATTVAVPMDTRGSAGLFIKAHYGDDKPADFMVDTGAAYVVID